ncbi:MAG: sensor histidine kinase [Bacteroidota bacterium]
MENFNKLIARQAQKYLGGLDKVPENYHAFIKAISESYDHYEKDHRLLERSIEISSSEMIELNEQLRKETEQLKKAHEQLRTAEKLRLEKRLDEEKIKKLHEITDAVIEAQERERSFLSAELHDNVNQILATCRLFIDTAYHNEGSRLQLIKDSKGFIDKAVQEIRLLCKSLVPPLLDQTTLTHALEDMIRNIRQTGQLQINTDWENIDEGQMCEKMKLAIFRITQEQMNNIFKHAHASTITIKIVQEDGKLLLSIKDDGVGFDTTKKRNGIGLQNIASRINQFKGEVMINSQPGVGCELIVVFHKPDESIVHKIAS